MKSLILVLRAAEDRIEKNKTKHLASREDIHPNTKFVDNPVLRALADNKDLNYQFENRKILWGDYRDTFTKIFREFSASEEFASYMHGPRSFRNDKKIVKVLYANYFANNESLHQIYEEMNMNWADYLDAAQMMVVKTLKVLFEVDGKAVSKLNFTADEAEKAMKSMNLPESFSYGEQKVTVELFKDLSDKKFGPELLTRTIKDNTFFDEQIAEKTRNWDADRIALIDNVLMKMALAELIHFQEIPIKVSMNEYIELSKMYSTPKSGQFINGVVDKIAIDLKSKGKIKKMGRGLL